MSEFYKYIGKIIINYLDQINLKNGDRYSIQFEKKDEVQNLYQVLGECAKIENFRVEEFKYNSEYELYNTYMVEFNHVKIIVAATITGVTEDFLIHLRNMIGKADSDFEDKALLFIHNTSLDSIIGGSKSLEADGMPLHIKSIENDLLKKIGNSTLNQVDKAILNMYLKRIRNNVFEEVNSIFDYQAIFKILELEEIPKDEYRYLGLFKDSILGSFSGKNLEERIFRNMDDFKVVDSIHNYSDLSNLDKIYDSKGVADLKANEWYEIEYSEVQESKERQINDSNPNFIIEDFRLENKGIVFWDRSENQSAAKLRKRSIIIYNENLLNQIIIKFGFDKSIKSDEVKKLNGKCNIETRGKKIYLTFNPLENNSNFIKWKYYKYEFNIAVINQNNKFLEGYDDSYLVNSSKNKEYIELISTEDFVLNNNQESEIKVHEITTQDEVVSIDSDYSHKIMLDELDDFDEKLRIKLQLDNQNLNFRLSNESITISRIQPVEVWKQKRELKSSFTYEFGIDFKSKKEYFKIQLNNRSYYPVGVFRNTLKMEKEILSSNAISHIKKYNELIDCELRIPDSLLLKYQSLLDYYRRKDTLPSITYLEEELIEISKAYVDEYFEILANVESDQELQNSTSDLAKVGILIDNSDDKIYFTSLHPINIAYNLKINDVLKDEKVDYHLLKRLNSHELVPYYLDVNKNLYKPINNELIEWTAYVNCDRSRFNSNQDYVSKIISSKIKEFISHFDYLFKSKKSPLNINLVNLGDCSEVLKGIFEYYTSVLRISPIKDLIPINIHILDDYENITVFDELTFYSEIDQIQEKFGIKLKTKNYEEHDVINAYRDRVRFYKKKNTDPNYAHLTFYKMEDIIEHGSNDMEEIDTGICLNGLISGVSSVFLRGDFLTGFGTKYLNVEDTFVKKIIQYNSS